MANTISQRSMRNRRIAGKAGMLAVLSHKRNRIGTATNSNPQARESKSLTIDTYTDGADYIVTLEGRAISYTATTADADASGVAASLAAQINQDAQVRGIIKATANAAVITLEALLPGLSFSASESDAKMTLADVQTAAQADAIPFGRVCVFSGDSVVTDKNRLVKLPAISDLEGKSAVLDFVVQDSNNYNFTLQVGGVSYNISFTSDASATAQEIATGLKADIDGESISGLTTDDSGAVLTLQADPGLELLIQFAAASNFSSVVMSEGTTLDDIFAGFALFTQDESVKLADAGDRYAPNSALSLLEADGDIFVENSQGVSRNQKVYVECASGDDQGKVYNAASATRLPLTLARFESDQGDDLAICRLR